MRGDRRTYNTVEGYYSIFKRGMKGIYQHCSEKHLHRYVAEFDFRYNNRIAHGVSDEARTIRALQGVIGKRLTYRVHGLAADNGLVRADVFLEKFRALLNSLKVADKYLNGKKSHNIVITDLKNGSATVAVIEKVSVKKRVPVFGGRLSPRL